jgi:two-component system chemotaxis sensor kinase CheA
VLESIYPRPEQIINLAGQGEVVILREEPIPLLRMNRYLGILDAASFAEPERPSGREQDIDSGSAVRRNLVIIVEHGVRKLALFVDALLGQQQVVIT